MIATLGGVLAASVVGSLHCAGMCGPLVSVAAAPVRVTSSGKEVMPGSAVGAAVLASVYNLGRLGTYLMLGAGAGAIGGVFDFGGRAVGVQRIAVMISGVMLLVMGIAMLLERAGIVTRRQLIQFRRYAIVLAVGIAAVLTPPDIGSQLLLAVPLILLYELAIIGIWISERGRGKAKAEAA